MSGLIAGIIGGIVVGAFSGSHVSVSGPAAGLTVIVLDSIIWNGLFSSLFSHLGDCRVDSGRTWYSKAGVIGYYFPHSVIKGMLTAIGLILILKQIPHGLGYDVDLMGDAAFLQTDEHNTFSAIWYAIVYSSPWRYSNCISRHWVFLIFFERPKISNHKILGVVPGALWAVISGIVINHLYGVFLPDWQLRDEHLVTIPVLDHLGQIGNLLTFPDFSMIGESTFWVYLR